MWWEVRGKLLPVIAQEEAEHLALAQCKNLNLLRANVLRNINLAARPWSKPA